MNSVLHTLKTNRFVQISIVAILLYVLYKYNVKNKVMSMIKSDFVHLPMSNVNTKTNTDSKKIEGFEDTKKSPEGGVVANDLMQGEMSDFDISGTEKKILENISTGASQLTTGDLLPKYDDASTFAKENPVTQVLKDQNFIISGYSQGMDTISSSKRIPYNDFRENILIPKDNSVSPWNMSPLEEGFVQRGV
jgi:hypothetical protein